MQTEWRWRGLSARLSKVHLDSTDTEPREQARKRRSDRTSLVVCSRRCRPHTRIASVPQQQSPRNNLKRRTGFPKGSSEAQVVYDHLTGRWHERHKP